MFNLLDAVQDMPLVIKACPADGLVSGIAAVAGAVAAVSGNDALAFAAGMVAQSITFDRVIRIHEQAGIGKDTATSTIRVEAWLVDSSRDLIYEQVGPSIPLSLQAKLLQLHQVCTATAGHHQAIHPYLAALGFLDCLITNRQVHLDGDKAVVELTLQKEFAVSNSFDLTSKIQPAQENVVTILPHATVNDLLNF